MLDPVRRAYMMQRHNAKRRGIIWQFTYAVWIAWWEAQLGPDWFKKRGIRLGQYVMARKNDVGPYSPENVECKTNTKNTLETDYCGKSKRYLPRDKIISIYQSSGKVRDIAKRHSTNHNTVHRIKTGKAYRNITQM